MLGAHDVELGVVGKVALNVAIFSLLIVGLWRIEQRIDKGQTFIVLASGSGGPWSISFCNCFSVI